MKPKGKYRRTPEVRARTSAAMRRSWQARRAEYPPETRVNVTVRAQDAKMLPRYGSTASAAVTVLLEGAALLRWDYQPERRRWTPSLPKCGACTETEVPA